VVLHDGITKIIDTTFQNCPNLTLTVTPGSYGESFARQQGYPIRISPDSWTHASKLSIERLDSETIAIDGYTGSDPTLVVPEMINPYYKVVTIAPNAFSGNKTIQQVYLPDSLESIKESAFLDCNKLRMVHIPGSVQIIEPTAFAQCYQLRQVYLNEGIKEIHDYAFEGCLNLTSLYLPQSLEYIAPNAFDGCARLTLIVKEGSYAHQYCLENGRPHAVR